MSEAEDAVQGSLDLLNYQNVERADAETKPPKYTVETDDQGNLRAKIDAGWKETQEILAAAKGYQQIMHGFAQQQFERARKIQENPWANVATTIAGSLAQAPDLPGWVQGLGRANLELNPSPQKLMARGAEFEEAGIKSTEGALGLQDRLLSHGQAMNDRRYNLESLKLQRESNALTRATAAATAMKRQFITDPKLYEAPLKGTGMSPEEAKIQANAWAEEAKVAKADHDLQQKTTNDLKTRIAEANIAHKKVTEGFSAQRVFIAASKAKLEENIKTGRMVNPLEWQKERRRLLELRQKAQSGALKTLISADKSVAEINNRYLGNKQLDDDGGFGTKIQGLAGDITTKASEAKVLAEQQTAEIDALLSAGDAAYEATMGTKPPSMNLAKPEVPKEEPKPKGAAEKAKANLAAGGLEWDPKLGWVKK